jgi:hypothetical protein
MLPKSIVFLAIWHLIGIVCVPTCDASVDSVEKWLKSKEITHAFLYSIEKEAGKVDLLRVIVGNRDDALCFGKDLVPLKLFVEQGEDRILYVSWVMRGELSRAQEFGEWTKLFGSFLVQFSSLKPKIIKDGDMKCSSSCLLEAIEKHARQDIVLQEAHRAVRPNK